MMGRPGGGNQWNVGAWSGRSGLCVLSNLNLPVSEHGTINLAVAKMYAGKDGVVLRVPRGMERRIRSNGRLMSGAKGRSLSTERLLEQR